MYVFCVLHADKAKDLQINLSEALQGKDFKALSLSDKISCRILLLVIFI